MENERYTTGQVWSVLIGASEDVDEALDVWVAWSNLPEDQRAFIYLAARGWPVNKVMELLGMKGNQTRLKQDILNRMTRILNGEKEDGETLRTSKQRAAIGQEHTC